ncbi:MAG TPA: TMEM175 family protein [Nitrososphaeraceae archaeon]|nr:TMEM175 family protein [Nitrososphaeraceae archaeon]
MQSKIRLEHLVSFSDAIFAFSITFMAVTIQIPNLPENLTQAQVIQNLIGELGPRFAIYVISFFVIAAYWISYHQIFNHIAGSHVVIVWLNLLFLFFITIIPFAVDLQIDYGLYQVIFILYALVLTAAGASLTLIWLHAMKGRLIDKTMNQTDIQSILLESIVLPSVFVISIFVSIVDLEIAYYFWMVIIPAKVVLRWKFPH